jgi:hypothetical protein
MALLRVHLTPTIDSASLQARHAIDLLLMMCNRKWRYMWRWSLANSTHLWELLASLLLFVKIWQQLQRHAARPSMSLTQVSTNSALTATLRQWIDPVQKYLRIRQNS